MLKTMLMCKACAVYKNASKLFLQSPTKEKESILRPLALMTTDEITIYKSCVSIPFPWRCSLFAGVIPALASDGAPWGCTPLFDKDWYIGDLLRALQAGIENSNQLRKNLSRLPRENLGAFMRLSTVSGKEAACYSLDRGWVSYAF